MLSYIPSEEEGGGDDEDDDDDGNDYDDDIRSDWVEIKWPNSHRYHNDA